MSKKLITKGELGRPYAEFGHELAVLRKAKGLSQEKLAELLSEDLKSGGIHRDTIGTWERGEVFPSSRNLKALKRHFPEFTDDRIYELTAQHYSTSSQRSRKWTPTGNRHRDIENFFHRLKTACESNDPLGGITALQALQNGLRQASADPGGVSVTQLTDMQSAVLDELGATFGFVEFSRIVRGYIEKVGGSRERDAFLANVQRGRDLLIQHYLGVDQDIYAAGTDLEFAALVIRVDKVEYTNALDRFHVAAKKSGKEYIKSLSQLILKHPRFLSMLNFLSENIQGTYPGLESARVLRDCGIGPHRLNLRHYLDELRSEMASAHTIHDGCLVCTAMAIEVLRDQPLRSLQGALTWIEEQRQFEWRGRRLSDGTMLKLGYNYTAAAMKALYSAGRSDAAHQVRELLSDRAKRDQRSGGLYWDGIDVDAHVATGRVLEACMAVEPLDHDIVSSSSVFIWSCIQPLRLQRVAREYDTWSMIGLICADPVGNAPRMEHFFSSLTSQSTWEENGSWSRNLYRSAMFARLLIEAAQRNVLAL